MFCQQGFQKNITAECLELVPFLSVHSKHRQADNVLKVA